MNFISIVNDLFPIALQFRLLSVWNIIQLRMFIFTLHVVFPLVPILKYRVLCDNCLVYGTSLVSNDYLDSNKCSVDNQFHFSSEWLVSYCTSIRLLSVWNIIQLRMSIFTLHVVFPLFLFWNAVFCAITFLYTDPSLVSNNYLGSNKCSVDNHFHFSSVCFVSSSLLFRLLSVSNIIQFRMSIFHTSHHFPPCTYSQKPRCVR